MRAVHTLQHDSTYNILTNQIPDATSTEESMKHAKRLLNSLTCVMAVYTATWALTILALGYTEVRRQTSSSQPRIQYKLE
jgi:hypothetical protein